MDRQIIEFSANEQSLIKTSGTDHYAGNVVRYIEAHFDLGENWSGYDSVRAIWRNKRDATKVSTVLNSEGVCVVPYEVLTLRGDVCMNLVGSIAEDDVLVDRLTTYPICALTVDVPAMVDGSDPASITPSEYEQFVASVRNDANRAEAGATASEASASEASASAEQATASAQASEASALRASGYASDAQTSERNASEYAQNASESATSAENAKEDAEDARDEILGMRATAETLAEGSQATASYSDGVLTLGIPRGDTGARGEKGETGETGATPNLSIGTVETLEPTESATATITGTAENPVLNLGLPQGRTGEVTYEDLESLLPKDTASGDVISIPDGQSIIPVESLKVTLEPIQSGTGTPSPDNVRPISGRTEVVTQRTGKNLFDKDNVNELNAYISKDKVTTNSNHRCVYIPCEPNTTYTVQKICVGSEGQDRFSVGYTAETPSNDVTCYGIIHSTTTSRVQGQMVSLSITTGSDAEYLICWISYSAGYANSIATFQVELGSTATAYEPYQGTTYTTDLGRTVYGGTLDVVSGELVVDRAMVDLGSLNWGATSQTNEFYSVGVPSHTLAEPYCDSYLGCDYVTSVASAYAYGNATCCFLQGDGRLLIRDDRFTSATDLKQALNGVQLCYELATPIKIQLTPQEIKLLAGDNTIWSDGQVTMVYSADVARWVEKKLGQ